MYYFCALLFGFKDFVVIAVWFCECAVKRMKLIRYLFFSMWAEFKESCIFNLGLYHTWKCVLDQEPTSYSSQQMWASFMQNLKVSNFIWKIVFSKRDENRHCLNFPIHRVESTTELIFGFSPLHLATFGSLIVSVENVRELLPILEHSFPSLDG